eukprot:942817-Pyramimonas_sp.AAC.1
MHCELRHFNCLSTAFQELITTFSHWGGVQGHDFPASLEHANALVTWCDQLSTAIEDGWSADLNATSDELKNMVPPLTALEDPLNLTDDAACDIILNHPKSDLWVKAVTNFGTKLAAIKDPAAFGPPPYPISVLA